MPQWEAEWIHLIPQASPEPRGNLWEGAVFIRGLGQKVLPPYPSAVPALGDAALRPTFPLGGRRVCARCARRLSKSRAF